MIRHLLTAAALVAMAPLPAFAQSQQSSNPEPQTAQASPSPDRRDGDFQGPREGNSEFTLSGTGANDRRFDDGSFGVTASYGKFLTDNVEASIRQSLNWANVGNDNTIVGTTRVAVDYHFNQGGRLRPFLGANIGYTYGDGVADTGVIGPEVGLKYFLNNTTFAFLQSEYQYFIDDGDDVADRFDDGSFVHTVGIGVLF